MLRSIRLLLALAGLATGLYAAAGLQKLVAETVGQVLPGQQATALLVVGGFVGGLLGFVLAPVLVRRSVQLIAWAQGHLFGIPTHDIAAGAIGLVAGLLIAFLVRPALSPLPLVGPYLPTVASLLLGYLGLSVAVHKREDLLGLVHLLPRGGRDREDPGGRQEASPPKLLDTSAIIDGRIADICQAGFMEGPLIIPSFILDELRHIADSSDLIKRSRGRRGLDMLHRIQKELDIPVRIVERDGGTGEVDIKLVRLAQKMQGKIVTNDFNLNKVAALHGVPVLNVNELANALKPVVVPGEEMTVQVIKDGKESGQGVAYLDDGTMIVVDGGKRHIGERIGVEVTSVLQTAAGRMIFARPKGAVEEFRASATHP